MVSVSSVTLVIRYTGNQRQAPCSILHRRTRRSRRRNVGDAPVPPVRRDTGGALWDGRVLLPRSGLRVPAGDDRCRRGGTPGNCPPVVARGAIKTIARVLDEYFQGRVRRRLTDEDTAVGLYEIQQRQMSDRQRGGVTRISRRPSSTPPAAGDSAARGRVPAEDEHRGQTSPRRGPATPAR